MPAGGLALGGIVPRLQGPRPPAGGGGGGEGGGRIARRAGPWPQAPPPAGGRAVAAAQWKARIHNGITKIAKGIKPKGGARRA